MKLSPYYIEKMSSETLAGHNNTACVLKARCIEDSPDDEIHTEILVYEMIHVSSGFTRKLNVRGYIDTREYEFRKGDEVVSQLLNPVDLEKIRCIPNDNMGRTLFFQFKKPIYAFDYLEIYGDDQDRRFVSKVLHNELEFQGHMFGRLLSDLDYYFGYGKRYEPHLWTGDFDKQILYLLKLRRNLPSSYWNDVRTDDIWEFYRRNEIPVFKPTDLLSVPAGKATSVREHEVKRVAPKKSAPKKPVAKKSAKAVRR